MFDWSMLIDLESLWLMIVNAPMYANVLLPCLKPAFWYCDHVDLQRTYNIFMGVVWRSCPQSSNVFGCFIRIQFGTPKMQLLNMEIRGDFLDSVHVANHFRTCGEEHELSVNPKVATCIWLIFITDRDIFKMDLQGCFVCRACDKLCQEVDIPAPWFIAQLLWHGHMEVP